jgi:hypothetical protein
MKYARIIIIIGTLIFLCPSCEWILKPGVCDATGPVIVYKTKKDYSENISVQLSKDGKSITAYPGPSDAQHQRPIQLANGYLLKRMVGDAFLSITFEEYTDTTKDWSNIDLIEYVIDTDPYLEKYECCECTGRDTAIINNLIRENRLGECEDVK